MPFAGVVCSVYVGGCGCVTYFCCLETNEEYMLFADDCPDSIKTDEADAANPTDRYDHKDITPSSESFAVQYSAMSELKLLQMAALQLGAVKCLNVILSSSKFVELLLVPKCDLGSTKKIVDDSSVKCESEGEMRETLRMILKQMVKRAVMPSPIKRSIQLLELERAQSMLQKVTIYLHAEETVGIQNIKGSRLMLDFLL